MSMLAQNTDKVTKTAVVVILRSSFAKDNLLNEASQDKNGNNKKLLISKFITRLGVDPLTKAKGMNGMWLLKRKPPKNHEANKAKKTRKRKMLERS